MNSSFVLITKQNNLKSVKIRQSCISSIRNCTYTEWAKKLQTGQGNVATYAKCGWILINHFTANSLKNLPVKLFLNLRMVCYKLTFVSSGALNYSNQPTISSPYLADCLFMYIFLRD